MKQNAKPKLLVMVSFYGIVEVSGGLNGRMLLSATANGLSRPLLVVKRAAGALWADKLQTVDTVY